MTKKQRIFKDLLAKIKKQKKEIKFLNEILDISERQKVDFMIQLSKLKRVNINLQEQIAIDLNVSILKNRLALNL